MHSEAIITIGAMGRLAEQKGFDILLDALAILKNKNITFNARIAGDGEDRQKLLQQARQLGLTDRVEFAGWASDKEGFMNGIDIFVLSSRFEPFGLVLLEAMKYKKPIVATPCEGPLDIITDGRNGILTNDFSSSSIAQKLELLINDAPLRKNITENAYSLLLQNYSEEVIGRNINNAILKIKAEFENTQHNI